MECKHHFKPSSGYVLPPMQLCFFCQQTKSAVNFWVCQYCNYIYCNPCFSNFKKIMSSLSKNKNAEQKPKKDKKDKKDNKGKKHEASANDNKADIQSHISQNGKQNQNNKNQNNFQTVNEPVKEVPYVEKVNKSAANKIKSSLCAHIEEVDKKIQSIKSEMTPIKIMLKTYIDEDITENLNHISNEIKFSEIFDNFLQIRRKLVTNIGEKKNLMRDMESVKISTEEKLCVICFENKIDLILAPCGHKCLCSKDGAILLKKNGNCPICRTKIDSFIKKVFE